MNYTTLASLRNDLILILLGIGIFVTCVVVGLLTVVPEPPAAPPELPEHMTPITTQVGKGHPSFVILGITGIGVFGAGIAISVAGAVGRKK